MTLETLGLRIPHGIMIKRFLRRTGGCNISYFLKKKKLVMYHIIVVVCAVFPHVLKII